MSDDRGEREKLSWSEIDKLRSGGRTGSSDRPRGQAGRKQAERESREALEEAAALFSGDPGGEEGQALANAVRDAHGTPDLGEACRAYIDALGVPNSLELLQIVLDCGDADMIVPALERLYEQKQGGNLEVTHGLKSQLRILAQEPNDDVAGLSEDLLA